MAFNQKKPIDEFKLISTTEQSDNNSSTSRSIIEKKTIQILQNKDLIPFRKIDKNERITNENTRKIYYQTTTTRQIVTTANPNFINDFTKKCNLESNTVTISRLTGENKETIITYPNNGTIPKQSKPRFESDSIKINNLSNVTPNSNRKYLNNNFSLNKSTNINNNSKAIKHNYVISPITNRQEQLSLSSVQQRNNQLRSVSLKDLSENALIDSNPIKLNTKFDAFKNETPKYFVPFSNKLNTTQLPNNSNIKNISKPITHNYVSPIIDRKKPLTLSNLKPENYQLKPNIFVESSQIKLNKTKFVPKLSPAKLYIFNHDEFKNSVDNREGSRADVDLLKNTFNIFQINADECNNFTVKKIRDKVEKISKQNFSQNSAILIAILSHGGGMDMIHAYDNKYSINEDVLLPILTNKTLIGKPKILIVQACKGEIDLRHYDTDSNQRSTKFLTPDEIFKFYSTSEGFVSLRDRKTGSIFIKAFCAELLKSGHIKCIRSIMDDVTSKVKDITNGKQIPSMCVNNTAPYILGKYI